jgi:anti-sigma factor RsiW
MNEHIDSETLIDYLHRELASERDAAVLAHLSTCGECAAVHEAEARLSERLRADARATERELPPRIVARVRSVIALESQPSWWHQMSQAFRPAVALPTAAVLVLATVLGFSALHPRMAQAPAIAAGYYLDDHAALSSSTLPFAQTAVVPEALEASGDTASRAMPVASAPASTQSDSLPADDIASE